MDVDMLFVDRKRQSEVYGFYEACQMQRNHYRGYPKSEHPLDYFKRKKYAWESPPELTSTFLAFPFYHVQYKAPPSLNKKINYDESFNPRYTKVTSTVYKR